MQTFAVIGLGEFGASLAVALAQRGARVVAIDSDPGHIERIKDRVVEAIQLDATDIEAVRAAGLDVVDTAVVAIGADVESAILVTALLAEIGIPRIIARSTTPLQAQILARVGAHRVISLEQEMAERVAGTLVTTGALAGLELDGGQVLVELQTPKEFVGKTLAEIDVRRRWGVSVVAFLTLAEERTILGRKRQTRKQVSPDPQRRIEADDILLVIGDQKSINEMTG